MCLPRIANIGKHGYNIPVTRKSSAAAKQLHVFWRGRVQGVGFRYTAESTALALKLTGWVRNVPDGRVEALCEGSEARLKRFLEAMRTGPMQPYIQGSDVTWDAATGEFHDFTTRFY